MPDFNPGTVPGDQTTRGGHAGRSSQAQGAPEGPRSRGERAESESPLLKVQVKITVKNTVYGCPRDRYTAFSDRDFDFDSDE